MTVLKSGYYAVAFWTFNLYLGLLRLICPESAMEPLSTGGSVDLNVVWIAHKYPPSFKTPPIFAHR